MHRLDFFDVTRVVGISLDICIVTLALRTATRWWSLVAYCSAHIAFCIAMFPYAPNTYRYFYLYWLSQGVSALLRLWILRDVIASFPGASAFRRNVWLLTWAMGGSMAAFSWHTSHASSSILAVVVKRTMVDLTFSISLAWGAFYFAALFMIAVNGIAWSRRGALVANGLAFNTVAYLAVSLLLGGTARAQILGQYMLILASLTTLSMWLYALSRDEEIYELPNTVVEALKRRRTTYNIVRLPRDL